MVPADVSKAVDEWLRMDKDPVSRAQVDALLTAGNEGELRERFCTRMTFGTAGLRSKMGPGFGRMNVVTVQQAAQGFCRYLQDTNPAAAARGVVIGYDGRHGSQEFARVSAAVFASRGIQVFLFPKFVPTPLLAFSVTALGCVGGIMVTASHNPKEYNGYKVYLANGCQIIEPHDALIAASIAENLELWPIQMGQLAWEVLVADPYEAMYELYVATLAERLLYCRAEVTSGRQQPEADDGAVEVAYTPLHGVGGELAARVFAAHGLKPFHRVEEQFRPDPEFPTVVFPNPEEGPATWALALATGDTYGCQLALANDPDADRLAVAERGNDFPGGEQGGAASGSQFVWSAGGRPWRVFSGNEIGILLAHFVWTRFREANPQVSPQKVAMLSTAVSSKMLAAMAAVEGFTHVETLTGFKWLGNRAVELEAQGYTVLFAFEEAIGFMFGQHLKDKDGMAAAAVFTLMAGYLRRQHGRTVAQHLNWLYSRYGYFECRQGYLLSPSPAQTSAMFDGLRAGGTYLSSLGMRAVVSVRDLGTGVDTGQSDGKATLQWSSTNMMVTFRLRSNAVVTIRASGTEPKVKYYLEVRADRREQAAGVASELEEATRALMAGYLS
eukprot:jgi/Mesvir1/10589/Mv21802-RA.1